MAGIGRRGTKSRPGSVWRRSLGSTSPKAPRCTSKAGSRPHAGRIGRVPSGERKYRTEIVARDLLLLGPRENSGGDHQRPKHNENQDQPSLAGSGEIVDQDIPFRNV